MLLATRLDIERTLTELQREIREVEARISGRTRSSGSLVSVAKRIMISAERLDRLMTEAESRPNQSPTLGTQLAL